MAEKQEKIMYLCTQGPDSPEKAAIPFVMANAALAMDIQATIVLQADAVYLARKEDIDHILHPGGFDSFRKLITDFLELGGKIKVCVPCIKARNIDEADLIEGAETTAAGALNIEAIESDAVFTY